MDIWRRLQLESRPLLLYGSGAGAEKIYQQLTKQGTAIQGVFASDGFKKARKFHEFSILPYQTAKEQFGDFLALFAFGTNEPAAMSFTKSLADEGRLLCAEMPVCGDSPFDKAFAREHKAELTTVYHRLADRQSKKVFEETIRFKLEGNIDRLFAAETPIDEAFENILQLTADSSFLDLGAYTGDTVLDFVKRVGRFSHITAVEPDNKSFLKLQKNTKSLSPLRAINAAVGERVGQLPFTLKAGRGSVAGGRDIVPVVTVDSLGEDFDYIKMDIEGEELRAIYGAASTIANKKPKMLISAYHRIEDYFTLPLAVLNLRPDYQLYMRHHPCLPAWETNFYFV